MLEIIFAACSLLEGNVCRDFHLTLDPVPGITATFQCLTSQAQIADWQNEHPNWKFKGGYTCGPAGQIAKT